MLETIISLFSAIGAFGNVAFLTVAAGVGRVLNSDRKDQKDLVARRVTIARRRLRRRTTLRAARIRRRTACSARRSPSWRWGLRSGDGCAAPAPSTAASPGAAGRRQTQVTTNPRTNFLGSGSVRPHFTTLHAQLRVRSQPRPGAGRCQPRCSPAPAATPPCADQVLARDPAARSAPPTSRPECPRS